MTGIYPDWDEIERRLAEGRIRVIQAVYRAVADTGGWVGGIGEGSASLVLFVEQVQAQRDLHEIERRMRGQWIIGERKHSPFMDRDQRIRTASDGVVEVHFS